MASPQKENGYVAIANEIVDALSKTQLSGYESRLIWAVWRKTYAWHKKDDWISLSQFGELTGLRESHICRTLKRLVRRDILTKNGNKYSFQKDYQKWQEDLPKMVMKLTKNGNSNLPKMADTKETITKATKTKETITKRAPARRLKPTALKAIPTKSTKMGIVTIQDDNGEIKPVMRINTWGKEEVSVYGNREVELSVLALEEHLGGKPDGTQKSERLYARHLTNALAKEYPDQDPVELVKQLLKAVMLDQWFAKNCTSLRWLYYNKQKVIQSVKNQATFSKVLKAYE